MKCKESPGSFKFGTVLKAMRVGRVTRSKCAYGKEVVGSALGTPAWLGVYMGGVRDVA